MILLDGKKASEQVKEQIRLQTAEILKQGGRAPHLAAIIVGNNGASLTYVSSKVKTCAELGFKSTLIELDENVSEENLLEEIKKLNQDDNVDGFIVQLPLPKHIDEQKIIMSINPEKDVDGFHPQNIGKMALGLDSLLPATPFGIIELIRQYKIETKGKNVVVIGRSNIVGMPISLLMSQKRETGNATVTICHSHTKNLKEICKNADIIIAALGSPYFVKEDMVKCGAVVIDVGITRIPDASKKSGFKIAGDVDFENVAEKCSYITPVPAGVGLMTISMLMLNTLKARKNKENGKN